MESGNKHESETGQGQKRGEKRRGEERRRDERRGEERSVPCYPYGPPGCNGR
jgi:hypothetical protein